MMQRVGVLSRHAQRSTLLSHLHPHWHILCRDVPPCFMTAISKLIDRVQPTDMSNEEYQRVLKLIYEAYSLGHKEEKEGLPELF